MHNALIYLRRIKLEIGKYDVFEREYSAEFKKIISKYGEVINYEKDRGARDIGVHFTKRFQSGNEYLSNSLVWFQLKGITKERLGLKNYNNLAEIDFSLKVDQLKYWYIQSISTYLVIFIECKKEFLILNLKKYLSTNYKDNLLTLTQKYLTLKIPKTNLFDEDAITKIIRVGDIQQLMSVFKIDKDEAVLGLRDFDIIYRLGTSDERKTKMRIFIKDWQSKTRNEIYFQEDIGNDKWKTVHSHWQFLLLSEESEEEFPYLEFENYYDDDLYFDDEAPYIDLSNGERIIGEELAAGEVIQYYISISLNKVGEKMSNWLEIMIKNNFFEFDLNKELAISVAPWGHRNI